jgi:hypothetical protein
VTRRSDLARFGPDEVLSVVASSRDCFLRIAKTYEGEVHNSWHLLKHESVLNLFPQIYRLIACSNQIIQQHDCIVLLQVNSLNVFKWDKLFTGQPVGLTKYVAYERTRFGCTAKPYKTGTCYTKPF